MATEWNAKLSIECMFDIITLIAGETKIALSIEAAEELVEVMGDALEHAKQYARVEEKDHE